jgi:hypothetical protein
MNKKGNIIADIGMIFAVIIVMFIFVGGFLYIKTVYDKNNNTPNENFECYHNECAKYIYLEQLVGCYEGCKIALRFPEECIEKCIEKYDRDDKYDIQTRK